MGLSRSDTHLILTIFIGALLAVQAWDVRDEGPLQDSWGAPPEGEEDMNEIASGLFGEWAVPFEVLSILLLVALVGGIAMAFRWGPPRGER